jgi:quercetin 2,3-dioxygenase
VITVQPAAARYRSERGGVTTWHCFSSGDHYDPGNVAFGPIVACDEHEVAGGAGFDRHSHARVELLSWVLEGELRHEDPSGRVQLIRPGHAQHQLAGRGIEHAERNASGSAPLRFVQLWLLTDGDEPDYEITTPPIRLGAGRFAVLAGNGRIGPGPAFAFAAAGEFTINGHGLRAGDALRSDGEALAVRGAGELLVVELS